MLMELETVFYVCVLLDTSMAVLNTKFAKMADSTFGYTYSLFPARSAPICCAHCIQDTGCKSVGYLPDSNICELKSNSPGSFPYEVIQYIGKDLYYRPLVPCNDTWTQYGDHCYLVDATKRTWADCQSFCQSKNGANLTSITSQQENEHVWDIASSAGLLNPGFAVWIGMGNYAIGGFGLTWVDGTGFDFTAFGAGEPNGGQGETCLEIGSDKTWNDKDCATTWPCVCKLKMDFA